MRQSKAWGGTELMRDRILGNLDPDLRNYFQFILSRKRELEDKPRIFWTHETPGVCDSRFLCTQEGQDLFAKIVFVSHWQQEQFLAHLKVPYRKGIVLQNAITPLPYHVKPRNGVFKLIYASTPFKGLDVLLDAFEFVSGKRDDVELNVYSSFRIYDKPWMDKKYQSLYERARNIKHVNYHGSVSNEEIRKALQETHILAYPATTQETSCLTVIESMSAGCLCLVPNWGALPETCANFAWMYTMDPNPRAHADKFAELILHAVDHYWDSELQQNLILQKTYFDTFYNLQRRLKEWSVFLSKLRSQIEAEKRTPPVSTWGKDIQP
jgi:glycosyltransferase involved in cell wall biosynthesis